MDFPTWPSYTEEEIEAVQKILQSGRVNYWTGSVGKEFEKEFAQYTGTLHAIAVSNGSVALAASLHALNIGQGAEVIVTPRTFVASASEIVLAGAKPVFADVDIDSQNITPKTIEPLITSKTRAILTVHLAGWPCDMLGITEIAKHYDLCVIEDCAQSHGASIHGRKVGSWGDVAAFSFCQDKIITTGGEGGMLTTSNPELWKLLWSMKDHGKGYDITHSKNQGTHFRWLHQTFGTNWRLTEMQSAIGRIQTKRLNEWVRLRKRNAETLLSKLENESTVRVVRPDNSMEHAYYKCYVFVRPETLKSGWDRDRILSELITLGIPCGTGSCPEVYRESAFLNYPSRPKDPLPIAKQLGETSIMFQVHPTLTQEHMVFIGDSVCSVLAKAKR